MPQGLQLGSQPAPARPAPPMKITDAQGLPPGFHMRDLRGRWVLVQFWSYSSPRAMRESLPKLARFCRENRSMRNRFTVLAFHAKGDMKSLKPHLRALQAQLSNGRPLPFPVVLDRTGRTMRAWNVTRVPATVLVDPEGRVVPNGSVEELGRLLAAEARAGGHGAPRNGARPEHQARVPEV